MLLGQFLLTSCVFKKDFKVFGHGRIWLALQPTNKDLNDLCIDNICMKRTMHEAPQCSIDILLSILTIEKCTMVVNKFQKIQNILKSCTFYSFLHICLDKCKNCVALYYIRQLCCHCVRSGKTGKNCVVCAGCINITNHH